MHQKDGSPVVLSSARLAFESLTADHAPLLLDSLRDERIYEFLPFDPPASIDELRATYTRWSTQRSPDGSETWLNWALRVRESDGYVGTVQATLHRDRSATIAYIIFPRFWGFGFGREAVGELVRFLFTECDVACVRANIDSRNTASLRLVEFLQFSREGLTKNADHFKGSASDEYHFFLRDPNGPDEPPARLNSALEADGWHALTTGRAWRTSLGSIVVLARLMAQTRLLWPGADRD